MAEKITLQLDKRQLQGRKVKQLRRQGIVPANIFGHKIDSLSVQLKNKDLEKIYKQAGETTIIYATIDSENKQRPLLISSTQVHPVTGFFLHVDFHQVDLTEKVTATIPIVLVGESPAVADSGAVLVQMINEVEVEALPADLPHEISLDISTLKEFGDSLAVKDLKVDTSKVEIKAEPEEQIVQSQEPQKEEEVIPVESAAEGEPAPTTPAPASEEKTE